MTIRDLFVESLRMRPDRIVIGEVRRGEALDFVQAMISGHSGSMATIHASTPSDAATRLETLSLMSGVDLPLHVARAQVAAALQIIVQINRSADGGRRVSHISQCLEMDERGNYRFEDLFHLQSIAGDSTSEQRELRATGSQPYFADRVDELGIRDRVELTKDIFLPRTL
jgi:pilus assembly protein CpaF